METSIEWLIDKLTEDSSKFLFLCDKPEYMDELIKIVKEAKAMERKQMIDLVKYVLKEVDFNQPQVPYEIVDLYLITDENKP